MVGYHIRLLTNNGEERTRDSRALAPTYGLPNHKPEELINEYVCGKSQINNHYNQG